MPLVKVEPSSDANIDKIVEQIRRRIICALHPHWYLGVNIDTSNAMCPDSSLTTNLTAPAPWQPPCAIAWLLASKLDNRSAVSERGLRRREGANPDSLTLCQGQQVC